MWRGFESIEDATDDERAAVAYILRAVDRLPLTSSMMASVGYDPRRRTLEIEFRTGGVYRYFRVPAPVFRALREAPSKGRFFHAHIDGVFEFARAPATSPRRRVSTRPVRRP